MIFFFFFFFHPIRDHWLWIGKRADFIYGGTKICHKTQLHGHSLTVKILH